MASSSPSQNNPIYLEPCRTVLPWDLWALRCQWWGRAPVLLPTLGGQARPSLLRQDPRENEVWLLSIQNTLETYQRTQAATTHQQESPLLSADPVRTQDTHLLYICVGISIWENIWVLLPEDVAHSAAGDDLQAAAAHPHSEGDFCKIIVPPSSLLSVLRRGGDTR